MKNSPGSMIGGIGLTPGGDTDARTMLRLVNVGILGAHDDRRRSTASGTRPRVSRVARNSLSSRALTSAPARFVVDDGDDELHRAEYRRRGRPGSIGMQGVPRGAISGRVYDARPTTLSGVTRCQQELSVSTDGSTSDLPASLTITRSRLSRRPTLSPTACWRGGVESRAGDGCDLVQDPDRPGLQAVAAVGFDEAASRQLATDVDPAHPFAAAAAGRTASSTGKPRWPMGRRNRCLSPAGRRRGCPGLPRTGLAGTASDRAVRPAGAHALARWLRSPWIGRAWRRRPRSAPSGSSGWPTPIR